MIAERDRQDVTVGVDGSENALSAVRWAAPEARRRRVPLRVVTAFEWGEDRAVADRPGEQQLREVLHDLAGGVVRVAADVARAEAPGLTVDPQVRHGSPVEVLRAESRRAGLLVLADHGAGRLERLVAGSVAVAMTTHADCPVVVVHGALSTARGMAGLPVVLGIDGLSAGEAAIGFAFEAAAAREVPLIAVHSWWDPVTGPALSTFLDLDEIESDERARLADRLAGWCGKYPAVAVGRAVSKDRPATALLAHAARAQLLVVGSRGRGELTGLFLGSVSNALVHRSPCPVAVVRPGTCGWA
jgi:nucleotide-binding universal stress UspA family protein